MKKVLITGANGLLGQSLIRMFNQKYEMIASGIEDQFVLDENKFNYRILDITNFRECKNIVDDLKPEVIINAASMTNVDECEIEKEACWDINVKGVKNLAKASKRNMAQLIHVSTDYVFDGENGPYSEDDRPDPIGYYGKSKLASENAVRMIGVPFAIIRTSVLFGLGVNVKQNFFLWLYNSLKLGKEVDIVTDQFNTPTFVDDLADGILNLVQRSAYGLFNISGKEYINRYDFSVSLADIFGFEKSLINPITTKSLNQKAERPIKGGLKIDKAVEEIEYNPKSLEEVFNHLKNKLQDDNI